MRHCVVVIAFVMASFGEILNAIESLNEKASPIWIAIDGRSGVGKSSFAKRLQEHFDALVIEGDDFYAGGVEVLDLSAEALARICIDWRAQARVLEKLRNEGIAQYAPFDWEVFDGSLTAQPKIFTPRKVNILEGVYSARPELSKYFDIKILIEIDEPTRLARLTKREVEISEWERQWLRAEDWYFQNQAPKESFDYVYKNL